MARGNTVWSFRCVPNVFFHIFSSRFFLYYGFQPGLFTWYLSPLISCLVICTVRSLWISAFFFMWLKIHVLYFRTTRKVNACYFSLFPVKKSLKKFKSKQLIFKVTFQINAHIEIIFAAAIMNPQQKTIVSDIKETPTRGFHRGPLNVPYFWK